MKVMVLAVGKSTRLYPFTGEIPKPMTRWRARRYRNTSPSCSRVRAVEEVHGH